jgi:hypothetical protein
MAEKRTTLNLTAKSVDEIANQATKAETVLASVAARISKGKYWDEKRMLEIMLTTEENFRKPKYGEFLFVKPMDTENAHFHVQVGVSYDLKTRQETGYQAIIDYSPLVEERLPDETMAEAVNDIKHMLEKYFIIN